MENQRFEIDNHMDDHVDEQIQKCFDNQMPKSFFTFAGAGSGKTTSLIKALTFLERQFGSDLSANSKQIAVITYTNAACNEILRRMQHTSIFTVSTIHSFLWELIRNYQSDIKEWVRANIASEIAELDSKQSKGRIGTDAYRARATKILKNKERLANLERIKRLSYNPNGENLGSDSLNHNEVVKMGAEFITFKDTMQKILVSKYPILLIDESQDTKKELIDAMLTLYKNHKEDFVIGMFGDAMQKIYMDGKDNLAACIPADWEKPTKVMNHRSATRIVSLANAIRKEVDGQRQKARSDAEVGTVRLFIVSSPAVKATVEKKVAEIMAREASDDQWLIPEECKSLILEHHMAASRLGFEELYAPLNKVRMFDTSLRDGTLPELSFLSNIVLPLVNAHFNKRDFEVSRILRRFSPILDRKSFTSKKENQSELIQIAANAVDDLLSLWNENRVPSCLDVLDSIKTSGLFQLPKRTDDILANPDPGTLDEKVCALRAALAAPFTQLECYASYVSGNTQYATHQGVKGLEFPRVVVIMDDEASRGTWFSYEKLFGSRNKTETDLENERTGKDSSMARTTRLFYVACTRAQKSLGVIAYTNNKDAVKSTALANGWFQDDEIIMVD
ncbi:AAA family ATPase [Alicyclobacillus fastidiosus]|uniref:AAA family ATPase n=1 Tax=Alicyclobacillus fastidiosus TaxID=392011 RepID=A0ABY6ZQ37_9BACL|nr:UvrD-helicase domain-containing protein [Alicyclobacillus fastidiosus]WAH44060.1 AAA family ATPase [Alicyclobacillus fastidiosus]GMA60347.1 DNA helicase [Alicyclobacillus fastidiosus]